jgi:Xaa-Pro aminopeptidase
MKPASIPARVAACLLLAALVPAAQDRPAKEPVALARVGDGRPVCGLGKEFHAGRRRELMARAGEELLVFRGLPAPRANLAFRQDKNFWYLTGVESPDAALVLDGKGARQILFLPERDLGAEVWRGEIWDAEDAWVKELAGFQDVRASDELVATLEQLLDGRKKLGTNLGPTIALSDSYDEAGPFDRRQADDPLDGRPSREQALAAKLAAALGVEIFDVNATLVDMRLVKTEEEIAAMRRAARAGALAHVEAMRSTRPGIGEWELDAVMTFVQLREGAFGKAYEAIVGSGVNACVLHYNANDRRLHEGEVVLIDYGPEVDHYTTDITRSWPTDGKFGKRAAELYDAVLAAQRAGIAACKPGATILDVSRACAEVLQQRGLSKYVRHGPCHYIGLEVHDPGDPRKPFVPGVAFTVEPGLYDREAGIGIRIEDVVVITATGCEVLSGLAPKERAEVETTVQAEGILERMPASGG